MKFSDIYLQENSCFYFDCKNCGNCCNTMEIRLSTFDIIGICEGLKTRTIEFLRDEVVFFTAKDSKLTLPYLKGVTKGECSFKYGSRCSIHKFRALNCRLFPLERRGEKYCISKDLECLGLKEKTCKKKLLSEYLEDQGIKERLSLQDLYIKEIKELEGILKEGIYVKYILELGQSILYDMDYIFQELFPREYKIYRGLNVFEKFNFTMSLFKLLKDKFLRDGDPYECLEELIVKGEKYLADFKYS